MNDLHWQVVCTDNKGYILEYNNYKDESKLLEYVQIRLNSNKVNNITITRWNRGERE